MLRSRFRAATSNSKQALMTDQSSQSPSSQKRFTKPIPSFFGSPTFKAFTSKAGHPETEPVMSPTSILDSTKPLSPFKNPFWYDKNQQKSLKVFTENKHLWDKLDSKGIGVALIDEDSSSDHKPIEDNENSFSKPCTRIVFFGTKLRVQIPPLPISALSPLESPKSPPDFGIKTRNSQLTTHGSGDSGIQAKDSPRMFTGYLSMSEMELSEDYTCVTSHGPNPKTTHIFDNCIVDNYCCLSNNRRLDESSSAPTNFLCFCYTCKKNLEQKNDIYIYRGEKAFCSQACRYQEMLLDGIGNEEFDGS